MSKELKIIGENQTHLFYQGMFKGRIVRFAKSKTSDEVLISADDALSAIGEANSVDEFLSTDKGLDFISQCKKDNPNQPLYGEDGIFSKLIIR